MRPSQGSDTIPAKGVMPSALSLVGGFAHQEADLPVPCVIAQRDRFVPYSPRRPPWVLKIKNASRSTSEPAPAHARVLAKAEKVAGGPVAEHLVGKRQRARRTSGFGLNIEEANRRRRIEQRGDLRLGRCGRHWVIELSIRNAVGSQPLDYTLISSLIAVPPSTKRTGRPSGVSN